MKKSTFVRRLSAWLMTAVMLLSTVPAMAAFRDTAGHWAAETLTEWQDKGLIDGYGDGSFQPDGTMTRAEFAKLVNRTLGFTAESAISFSDVTERDWFYAEVARAVAAGYAQGSGGMFRPNQPVTRAEAAAMLARALDLASNEERANAFTDAASIPAWAKGSVGAAAEAGCMTGYPDGAFGASGSITRAEAVVTLDRVLKSAKETVIENAGTTLENETIPGDLVIAESVGEGNVTLKNVTVLGSVIVKGGGANSIYFDGVRVGGTVRLQKENVHLRLMGDTSLDRVEIGLPCRITQDSTFKGALGTLVIDLEKTSNQKIQIEVPAKLVELLSRANVALNADVETLQIGKDAEGAQLDIKRGVTVGELSIDARVALTGSGLVISLVVSVSGVTVSGSLTVKKTETEGGAKAPTISGGSSSGGGVTLKEIESIAPITAEVPYGTSALDALAALPAKITLNVKDSSTVSATVTEWNWADGTNYEAKPAADTAYIAATAFTVPSGYTYSGTLTAEATVTIKALDTRDFNAALKAAQALVDNTVTEEAAAAADPANKILITSETSAANITKDVKFTTSAAQIDLEKAIKAAEDAKSNGFASQQACDEQTEALTVAVAAFNKTIKTGENATTNAYILQQVKEMLSNCDSAAYTKSIQPLKYNYTYRLYKDDGWAVPSSDVRVKIDWSVSGSGESYVSIGDTDEQAKDEKSQHWSYGAKITTEPTEPTEVTFTAKITRNDTRTVVGTIDYTATIGAPIRVDTTTPVTAPKMTSSKNSDISIRVPLTGAEYITIIDNSRITAQKNPPTEGVPLSITAASITEGGSYEVNSYGLFVPVTATIGAQEVRLAPVNPDPDTVPEHSVGNITVTIQRGALTVKEGSGWYVPDGDLTYNAEVWGCNPAITVTPQGASNNDKAYRNVSVQIEYAYKNFIGAIAFATENSANGAIAATLKVTFAAGDWGESKSPGQDLIACTKENVALDPSKTYYIWCNFDGNGNLSAPYQWLNTNITIHPTSDTQ